MSVCVFITHKSEIAFTDLQDVETLQATRVFCFVAREVKKRASRLLAFQSCRLTYE